MKRSAAFLVSLLVTATAVVACGSGSAADVSSDAGTVSADPPTECGTRLVEGGRCVADTACCVTAVASESPENGYRCTAGKWLRDQACLPPPVCTTPVTGSLTRSSGGAPLAVSCVNPGGSNRVVSVSVVLGSGSLELHLTRLPTAGEVVTLVPFEDVRAPAQQDAGADAGEASQTRAGFQVGYGADPAASPSSRPAYRARSPSTRWLSTERAVSPPCTRSSTRRPPAARRNGTAS